MGWITLPRNLLERQFDDLGLERTFENGIIDTEVGTEPLSDYSDPEEEARCAGSLEEVADDEVLRRVATGLVVRCHICGGTVWATWKRRSRTWGKATHYPR